MSDQLPQLIFLVNVRVIFKSQSDATNQFVLNNLLRRRSNAGMHCHSSFSWTVNLELANALHELFGAESRLELRYVPSIPSQGFVVVLRSRNKLGSFADGPLIHNCSGSRSYSYSYNLIVNTQAKSIIFPWFVKQKQLHSKTLKLKLLVRLCAGSQA